MNIANYYYNYIQNFISSENDFDKWKDHDEDEIFDFETKSIVPIPNDSAFEDADIVIFEDNFKGLMPLNGIRKKNFDEIEKLFKSIKDGAAKLKTSDDNVIGCIQVLLTREIGRKIIKSLCDSQFETKIKFGNQCEYEVSTRTITLLLDSEPVIGVDALGNRHLVRIPLYIDLGHEMIHAIHHFCLLTDKPSTLHKEWDDFEEQITETGLPKKIEISSDNCTDDNFDPKFLEGYSELNERNLTASYTNLKVYPRVGHKGFRFNSDDIAAHLRTSIKYNVWGELMKILAKNDPKTILEPEVRRELSIFLKSPEFLVHYLQWCNYDDVAALHFDQLPSLIKLGSREFLKNSLEKYKEIKVAQRELFYKEFTYELFRQANEEFEESYSTKGSLNKDETYHLLFDDLLKDARLIAMHLGKGFSYSGALISYLYQNPDKFKNLTDEQKVQAKKLFSCLFSNVEREFSITRSDFEKALGYTTSKRLKRVIFDPDD